MNHVKTVKRDKKGYYYRNLGWLYRGNGEKWTQPKFLLGRDEGEALDRLRRLERSGSWSNGITRTNMLTASQHGAT